MKIVAHHVQDALKLVRQAAVQMGPVWEPPQLVEIKRYKPPRSLPQNAQMHAMIRELANEIGYSEDELKDWFKASYGPKKPFSFAGVDKMIPKSTAEYSREEMSEMIAQIERIGAELNFRFSHE